MACVQSTSPASSGMAYLAFRGGLKIVPLLRINSLYCAFSAVHRLAAPSGTARAVSGSCIAICHCYRVRCDYCVDSHALLLFIIEIQRHCPQLVTPTIHFRKGSQ